MARNVWKSRFGRTTRLTVVLLVVSSIGTPTRAQTADVVLEWNAIMLTVNTVAAQGFLGPFGQARLAAITQLAVFEAVNAVTGDYHSYLGTISAPAYASAEAAAVAAAHRVLKTSFPSSAAYLDAARAKSLLKIAAGPAKDAGTATGEAAAAAMLALRDNDGSTPPQLAIPTSGDAGVWQPTTGCPGGFFLQWRNVKPFGVPDVRWFRAAPPPSPSSAVYAKDFAEVASVGGQFGAARTADREDVARFYAVTSGATLWNIAAEQIAENRGTSLSENARALALLNMAISDGAVASFETKYYYNYWRPVTAIHDAELDGNPKTSADPGFVPFIGTPCFPSYPSAHASSGYAARVILERLFGAASHSITLTNPLLPGIDLRYSILRQITDDIDDARVYGGIHFRFDQEAGGRQGHAIAMHIIKNNLRPARLPD